MKLIKIYIFWVMLSDLIIPPVNKVQGVYRNHSICPSVSFSIYLSVHLSAVSCRPITFFGLTLAYHIWHMVLSPWEDVSIHDPDTTMTFDLKVKLIGFMTCLCSGLSFFSSPELKAQESFSDCLFVRRPFVCKPFTFSYFPP